jgi:biopolymer transport protein ExbD
MKLNRKNKQKSEISTSSLPDIIFMLLIFFMVTTVMREFEGLDIVLPRAEKIEKLERTVKEKDDMIKRAQFGFAKEKAILEQKDMNNTQQISDLREQLQATKKVQENAIMA